MKKLFTVYRVLDAQSNPLKLSYMNEFSTEEEAEKVISSWIKYSLTKLSLEFCIIPTYKKL